MTRHSTTTGKAVRLTYFDNEPAARLAEQRLLLEGIPSVVRPLGVGPGLWVTAFNMPHGLDVLDSDTVRAAEVLDLPAAALAEGERDRASAGPRSRSNVGLILIGIAIAVILTLAAPALSQPFR